jgi:hypothetical protein
MQEQRPDGGRTAARRGSSSAGGLRPRVGLGSATSSCACPFTEGSSTARRQRGRASSPQRRRTRHRRSRGVRTISHSPGYTNTAIDRAHCTWVQTGRVAISSTGARAVRASSPKQGARLGRPRFRLSPDAGLAAHRSGPGRISAAWCALSWIMTTATSRGCRAKSDGWPILAGNAQGAVLAGGDVAGHAAYGRETPLQRIGRDVIVSHL